MLKNLEAGSVTAVYTEEQMSAKSGKPYTQLKINFANGYVFKSFLTEEQKMLIEQNKHTEVK